MKQVLEHIASRHQFQLADVRRLQGGDINEVFLLQTGTSNFVAKINSADGFPGMFAAEKSGLQLLAEHVQTPEVIAAGTWESWSYLLMKYCPAGSPSNSFWEDFSHSLARLHRQSQNYFGLDHNNYIGSLPQSNQQESDLITFYIKHRLEPQFKRAETQGFPFPNRDAVYLEIQKLLPREASSLIHGDLWNGNYLVSESGAPIFIDPAVCYGSREMDLAMMRLFGGFPAQVFVAYDKVFPLQAGWEERLPIWQLYYLLVHLNLFGRGYLSQVKQILERYS